MRPPHMYSNINRDNNSSGYSSPKVGKESLTIIQNPIEETEEVQIPKKK